ncbi:MAG: TIGR03620 family F420-dependent LLM class oxidoreductase [Ilumatobacteraceae bacterium]
MDERTASEVAATTRTRIGRVGIFSGMLRSAPPDVEREAVRRVEALGYGSIWFGESIGGKDAFAHASYLLAATSDVMIGTGIANVWARHPANMAGAAATVGAAWPGRFVHGLGVGHAPTVEASGQAYVRPLAHITDYLAGMDAARDSAPATPVPVPRLVAALKPRMLALARDSAHGALPYFVPPSHTPAARAILGPDRLLLVEQSVVLSTDATAARRTARGWMELYLQLPNYVDNLRRLGYADDVVDGGSDRLVDAIVAWGDEAAIAARVDELLAAGADSVLLQVLASDAATTLDHLAQLAPAVVGVAP